MRISFTGEHSYEINIQSNYAKHVWDLNVWMLAKIII